MVMPMRPPGQCILPPDLLDKLARTADEALRDAALDAMQLDRQFRLARAEAAGRFGGRMAAPVTFGRIGGQPQRTIYDQKLSTRQRPGTVSRAEGQRAGRDAAVNQAYAALGSTYEYYWQIFKRDSIDGQGLPMLGLVHYGRNYANAFWD